MTYEVHLGTYDGPFDLLLQLITAQEVDVYEIRLADIVDAFLTELARLESVDLEMATEFLLIAATLVELKCRRLLPSPDEFELDEELALFEARDYLLARLVECKMFTSAAHAIVELELSAARVHARRAGLDERFAEVSVDLLAGVTKEQIADAARRAMQRRPPQSVARDHVIEDEVSVLATVRELILVLPQVKETTFRSLTGHKATHAYVVACFLGLLELYKQSLVDLVQGECFGEIVVRWMGAGDVEYAVVESYDGRSTEVLR